MDGDGDEDVLAAWSSAAELTWHENLGDGTFGDPLTNHKVIASGMPGVTSIRAVDLDRDGDTDVLSASASAVRWFESDGTPSDGGWTARVIDVATLSSVRDLFPADVDGDGDVDVLVASATSTGLVWYENVTPEGLDGICGTADDNAVVFGADTTCGTADDEGLFGAGSTPWPAENLLDLTVAGDVEPVAVVAADVDGDGDDDVVIASCNQSVCATCPEGNRVSWFPTSWERSARTSTDSVTSASSPGNRGDPLRPGRRRRGCGVRRRPRPVRCHGRRPQSVVPQRRRAGQLRGSD